VQTPGTSSWPNVEDRREALEVRTETGLMYEERYLGAMERNILLISFII